MNRSGNELRSALAAARRSLVDIAVFSAVINLLMLAPALYMLQVYDRVLASGNQTTLLMLTVMVVGLLALMGALDWLRGVLVIRLGTRLELGLHARVHDAAHAAQLRNGQGAAGQALQDLASLRQFASGTALFAVLDAPWFALFLWVIFMFHPALGALALGGAVLLVALAWLNEWLCGGPQARAGQLAAMASQQASAHLANAEAVQAMGMIDALRGRWLAQQRGFLTLYGLASERTAVVGAWSKGIRLGLQSLVLGLGAWLAVNHQISPGMMIAGSILMGRVLGPIDQLIGAWKQWGPARDAYGRLVRLLQAHPQVPDPQRLPAPKGALALFGLCAAAPGQAHASLHELAFELPAGSVLGVIGPSGSGKSTLARVLVGVWPPLAGQVRLDSAQLSHWSPRQLGPQVGYLPQDIQLFAGTVAQNIARFGPADADKLLAAAQLAGVHELVLQWPQGYDTCLGEGGAGLSGGQKQRIALARALYGLPALIVLDEPNANLDEAGERALLAAIDRLKALQRTVVLITHRPNVLTRTDHLLMLHDGRLHRFGATRAVLAAQEVAA
ncbi:type 1 secretion system ATPase HasD [Pseudomonas sp. M47T1]|uniref:type I secretion system permease/ATPase n=1 Tax=Pseudomonas sp. M47T1 TaxID=1179778 RepID=UPI0002608616|nr:type I secretion system permease/ATPase [Pseudomonas sp. M47T1]EIK93647.1 type 1 secretion system ATPase HasD [Pseudomonas sp. M47T1]